jgi:Protein of unknown function (DUF1587)
MTMGPAPQAPPWKPFSLLASGPLSLNRTDYSNTIRDLLGVSFGAEKHLPADDYLADVLTVSPFLMECYFDAAEHAYSIFRAGDAVAFTLG